MIKQLLTTTLLSLNVAVDFLLFTTKTMKTVTDSKFQF